MSSAHADVYTLTTEGQITYGVDLSGVFGPVGSLDGEPYSISMTFNSALNADDELDQPTEQCLYSQLYRQAVASVTATIGGVTVNFPQSEAPGGFCVSHYPGWSSTIGEFEGAVDQVEIEAASEGVDFIPVGDFDKLSFPIVYDPATDLSGGMTETMTRLLIPGDVEIDTYGATLVKITRANSIPEPETWGMLLAGLGLTGGAFYFGRKKVWVRKREQTATGMRIPSSGTKQR
jgi:hypothetical protein